MIFTLVGTGAALGYAQYGPVSYTSTALVLVPPQTDPSTDSLGSPGKVRDVAGNFAAQASSPYIFQRVSQSLQGQLELSARDLTLMAQDKRLDIRPVRNANLISITVAHPDPATAQLIANTIATVFVEDVNSRVGNDVDARKQQLEQQIESTRQLLTTAQLQQREQELTRALREQRGQLLQIQLQYQQELQRQVEEERQALAANASRATTLSPEQQQRLQELAEAAAGLRAQSLETVRSQQQEVERSIAELSRQLGRVRQELTELAAADDPAASAEQPPLAQLQQREQELTRALREQRSRLLQVQQELERQLAAQAQAVSTDQSKLTPEQQQRLKQLADSSAEVRSRSIQLLREEQKELEQSITAVTAQLGELRAQLAEAAANPPAEATAPPAPPGQRQQLIAQLQQREQELTRALREQRGQLLQIQLQYQQELQRQVEEERRAIAASSSQPEPKPETPQASQALAEVSARVRTKWFEVLSDQQKEVEANIAEFSRQLAEVRAQLSQQPAHTDPAVAAAFADAYAKRLHELTSELVRLQLNSQAARNPLAPYGPASEPLATTSLKKLLPLGTGGGLALGLGLAYLLHLWVRRRSLRRTQYAAKVAEGLPLLPSYPNSSIAPRSGVLSVGGPSPTVPSGNLRNTST